MFITNPKHITCQHCSIGYIHPFLCILSFISSSWIHLMPQDIDRFVNHGGPLFEMALSNIYTFNYSMQIGAHVFTSYNIWFRETSLHIFWLYWDMDVCITNHLTRWSFVYNTHRTTTNVYLCNYCSNPMKCIESDNRWFSTTLISDSHCTSFKVHQQIWSLARESITI